MEQPQDLILDPEYKEKIQRSAYRILNENIFNAKTDLNELFLYFVFKYENANREVVQIIGRLLLKKQFKNKNKLQKLLKNKDFLELVRQEDKILVFSDRLLRDDFKREVNYFLRNFNIDIRDIINHYGSRFAYIIYLNNKGFDFLDRAKWFFNSNLMTLDNLNEKLIVAVIENRDLVVLKWILETFPEWLTREKLENMEFYTKKYRDALKRMGRIGGLTQPIVNLLEEKIQTFDRYKILEKLDENPRIQKPRDIEEWTKSFPINEEIYSDDDYEY